MALEDQMEMNFGPTPNPVKGVDPVSGNEIPVGSTAENVRDDIPANLSEGEMVIAADVVNFYGIKFFEDLRDNAKREYARMNEEGRIGGQPMEEPMMGNELGLDISDLEVVESMDEPVNAAEGVLASDEPFYSKRGGFDMSQATVPVDGGVGVPGDVSAGIVEIRQYQNDEGHVISVTFIDGVAQSEIPEGYYPVAPVVTADTPAQTQEPSGDSDRDRNTPMPEGIKYEELTIDELAKLVEGQQNSVIGGGLSRLAMSSVPVLGVAIRMALWDQNRRLKNEIERRLADPNLSDIERMQLNNLRIIKGETTFFDRLFGKDVPSMVATPADNEDFIKRVIETPEDFLPPSVAGTEPYTPEVYDPSDKTPEVLQTNADIIQESIKDAADKQLQEEAEKISAQAAKNAFKVSTPQPTPVNEMSDRVKKARQNTQKVMQDMRDRGASREERTASLKAAARTEQVLKDMDRGIIRGFEKGGLVDKPKVKEVVKGLEKASKSHAKQAAKLKSALGAKKKK